MTTYFSKDHEWISVEGDLATVGVTDHAQGQLGDVVFVELPEVGRALTKGEDAAIVESVKAASEIYAPITGEVVAVNEALTGHPGLVNEDAQGRAWFFRMRVAEPSELEALMDAQAYAAFVSSLS